MNDTGVRQAEDVLGVAAGWPEQGEAVALATVTQTWGSSPRPAGSQLAISASGRMAGSVSGGCIEGAVAEAAQRTLASGAPQVLEYGVTDERAWEVGLACGGRIKLFVEKLRVTPAMLAALNAARGEKRPVVLATRLPDGAQCLLPDAAAEPALAEAAETALRRDESRSVQLADAEWFLQVYNPTWRLVVVGAVHIAQALVPLAAQLDVAAIVVDPRRSFASEDRFPGVRLLTDWPDEALDALAPDSRTAVVTLTHDPKLDDPALDRALRSDSLYIGALGSRKTHAARLQRLGALGHAADALARIRGPVGLDLGAVTAPEIALSIVAEFVAVRRHASLAERVKPVRAAA